MLSVVTPCSLVANCQCFWGNCFLYLLGRPMMMVAVSLSHAELQLLDQQVKLRVDLQGVLQTDRQVDWLNEQHCNDGIDNPVNISSPKSFGMHSSDVNDNRPILNLLTPNVNYSGRTAPLTSKRSILYIYWKNIGTEYFKHGIYSPFFFSSKCSLFHNSNIFGSCVIHVLYTECAKIKK